MRLFECFNLLKVFHLLMMNLIYIEPRGKQLHSFTVILRIKRHLEPLHSDSIYFSFIAPAENQLKETEVR